MLNFTSFLNQSSLDYWNWASWTCWIVRLSFLQPQWYTYNRYWYAIESKDQLKFEYFITKNVFVKQIAWTSQRSSEGRRFFFSYFRYWLTFLKVLNGTFLAALLKKNKHIGKLIDAFSREQWKNAVLYHFVECFALLWIRFGHAPWYTVSLLINSFDFVGLGDVRHWPLIR
jgi:hypothetical protein